MPFRMDRVLRIDVATQRVSTIPVHGLPGVISAPDACLISGTVRAQSGTVYGVPFDANALLCIHDARKEILYELVLMMAMVQGSGSSQKSVLSSCGPLFPGSRTGAVSLCQTASGSGLEFLQRLLQSQDSCSRRGLMLHIARYLPVGLIDGEEVQASLW